MMPKSIHAVHPMNGSMIMIVRTPKPMHTPYVQEVPAHTLVTADIHPTAMSVVIPDQTLFMSLKTAVQPAVTPVQAIMQTVMVTGAMAVK